MLLKLTTPKHRDMFIYLNIHHSLDSSAKLNKIY